MLGARSRGASALGRNVGGRSTSRIVWPVYTRGELKLSEGARVPDLVGADCRLLIVGINPGLWTAATGLHFAHPSNRFYPALLKAGIIERNINVKPAFPSVPLPEWVGRVGSEAKTAAVQTHFAHPGNRFYPALLAAGVIEREIDRSAGMTDDDRRYLTDRGVAITNLVERATARASELTADELRAGRHRLNRFVELHQPAVVAVAGITAYRTAFKQPASTQGRQPEGLCNAQLWVVPNPSGLNAHETIASLSIAYREPAVAAGVIGE